jgi:hypothetical protein
MMPTVAEKPAKALNKRKSLAQELKSKPAPKSAYKVTNKVI